MIKILLKSKQTYLILALYAAILVWWLVIQAGNLENVYLFNWAYGLIGLSSAIYAWHIANKRWGGFKSTMGKLIIFLGIGLFAQWLGLQIWTYYNLIAKVEVPYPSLADIGYFALVPAYAIAAVMLAKVCGIKFSLSSLRGKLALFLFPALALGLAFGLFLRNVGFDTTDPIRLFFDIAYPVGEIIPATIALVVLFAANENIGGKMRSRILWLIAAFVFQFLTEYLFLYQTANGSYVNGGIADLMYATSYAIMGLGLVGLSQLEATTEPERA
jgi:hypothetical protein